MLDFMSLGIDLVERGLVPDLVVRMAIRRLCAERLSDPLQSMEPDWGAARQAFLRSLRTGPVAPVPEKANEQHYELPAEFFSTVLGPHRKYSCCFFPAATTTLAAAEEAALEITCDRADLHDGQDILELGCGWGSLSLWMAEHLSDSQITSVSNSASQRRFIEAEARSRRLENLQVVTADINSFCSGRQFDRIVSVEMFEHMRNFHHLLKQIAGWLRADGKLFVHHFCHREFMYPFETAGSANWMGQYFFTGGIMPSADLLRNFDQALSVSQQWEWSGLHYQRTAEAWLANLDDRRLEVMRILQDAYGDREANRWFQRWRMFFLAVSELFGYGNGSEWGVAHVLLESVATSFWNQEKSCPASLRR